MKNAAGADTRTTGRRAIRLLIGTKLVPALVSCFLIYVLCSAPLPMLRIDQAFPDTPEDKERLF